MIDRNFSMIEYFSRKVSELEPELSFKGKTLEDWQRWRKKLKAKLLELLGISPAPVPLNPEILWRVEEEKFFREKIILDTEEDFSIPLYLLIPKDIKKGEKKKALLCCHGHGNRGKDNVTGVVTNAHEKKEIDGYNYDYGKQFAERGYVVIAPDWRVFGELSDGGNPYPGRDKCNVHFIRGAMMGIYLLTLD